MERDHNTPKDPEFERLLTICQGDRELAERIVQGERDAGAKDRSDAIQQGLLRWEKHFGRGATARKPTARLKKRGRLWPNLRAIAFGLLKALRYGVFLLPVVAFEMLSGNSNLPPHLEEKSAVPWLYAAASLCAFQVLLRIALGQHRLSLKLRLWAALVVGTL